MSIEYHAEGHYLFHPTVPAHQIKVMSKMIELTMRKQSMRPKIDSNLRSWIMVHKAQAIAKTRVETDKNVQQPCKSHHELATSIQRPPRITSNHRAETRN